MQFFSSFFFLRSYQVSKIILLNQISQMSSKIKFAVDSDYTSDRCTVRMDHSGNITLAPVDQSSYRIRGQNKDPSTTDFKSPDVIETPMPPASVYFIINGGKSNLGDPLEGGATGNNSGRSSVGPVDENPKNSLGAMASEESQNHQKAILTVFFKGQSGLAAPTVAIAPRITFPSHPLSFDPPKLAPPKNNEVPTAVPTPEVLRLAQGPDQNTCPYELRARNIEPRIHITAAANNSICTFSTYLHDHLLFDQNGSAVGPKYGRAFGVLSSMHLKGLTPTAVCTSAICALVTNNGDTMSPPSSPLVRQGNTNAGSAYAHRREKSDASATGYFPATVLNQWTSTPEDTARQHKVLADALNSARDIHQHELKGATDGASKARLSWQTTKRKDEAIIHASKYTATIAFEPILFIGVHTGSIDVISLATQKELFRFNTSEIKGSKIIDGYSVSAIECVHSMAQSCVSSVLKAAQSLEGRVWVSGGSGSTRNYSAYQQVSGGGGGGNGSNPLNNSGSSATAMCSAETPIRSVYAAGYDNGEVLLLAISKTSGEVLRKVSYGTRPVTSILVGCLPWEMHTNHPYSKHMGRNYHKPNDVNGAGAATSGRDFFQLVWQQRDEFLFEMSGPADVQRLLSSSPSNEVSLTPPRSTLSDTDSAGDISPPSGGRYPDGIQNEPYPPTSHYSPPPAPSGASALPTAKRLTSGAFLRRSSFWNNFALVCVAGGGMHLVATSLSDAGERAEVRTVKEVSIRQFKSCGSIVAAKLFFSVAPGSIAHAECVRRDPSAQRQQLTFMAVTTQSNALLIFRLAFGLTEDPRSPLHNFSTVDISLIAKRDVHRSWINSLTVSPLPNKAFGFSGEGFGGLFRSPAEQNKSIQVSSSFATPNRKAGFPMAASGDFFGQRSIALNRSRTFGGAVSDDEDSYEPLIPFMLVALGMDQKLSFWICEASLMSPLGGAGPSSSPDGNSRLRASRRGTHTSVSMSLPSKANASTTLGVANTSFGLNSTQGASTTAPNSRLPITFSISQEPAMIVSNNNPKEEFEPWTSLSCCGVDGHQTFMCLGLRGRAKFYDCEIEENSGRVSAVHAGGGGAGAGGSSAAIRSSSLQNRNSF